MSKRLPDIGLKGEGLKRKRVNFALLDLSLMPLAQ